ncbi:MAG: hypothetical protein ACJ8M4_10115, partial [Chthoniobacterales bacterium]
MLRPLCFAALLLAALQLAFGQPQVSPTSSASPAPSKPVTPAIRPVAPKPNPPAKEPAAPEIVPPKPLPTAAAEQSAAPPPSVPGLTPVPDKTVTLQYPNSDVADVLHLYETLTNKKLIMDNFVQGKVSIFLSRPVPKDEAIKIIEINLLMNGYSLVPAENDVVKVIGTGRSPRNAGIPLISDEADLPEGEHVVTLLFHLRFADPVELLQVLGQYLSPP